MTIVTLVNCAQKELRIARSVKFEDSLRLDGPIQRAYHFVDVQIPISELCGLQESAAQKFGDFIGAKNQPVGRIPKSRIGVSGFEPPTT